MSEEQKRLLHKQIWAIAEKCRGNMTADKYKHYILGFIFYKFLSEKMEVFADKKLKTIKYNSLKNSKKDQEYVTAIKRLTIEKFGFFLKPQELFNQVIIKNDNQEYKSLVEELNTIFKNIIDSTEGENSESDFADLFDDLNLYSSDLGATSEDKDKLIALILKDIRGIDFELNDIKSDILGDAYEYLISQFASSAGKKGGEFYTPQQLSTILAKIVVGKKSKIKSAYDPTCGSASLLINIKNQTTVSSIFGQELDHSTHRLARMNMFLHGVHYADFDIKQGDTIESPKFDLEDRFEAIVANPPFGQKWSADDKFNNDDRFSQAGKLPPKGNEDYAFIQHIIYHLSDTGTAAVIMPHGALFRNSEAHIRQHLIKDRNFLDCVIGLPKNLFFGTSIPACIMVFKKCRENKKILFIDASNEFKKVGNKNQLTDESMNKVIDTFESRKAIDKYSHNASLKEIAENDYNLNIPRYVDTFEPEEEIDLTQVAKDIKSLDKEMQESDKIIAGFCTELDISYIAGNNIFLLGQYKTGLMQQLFSQTIRFKADDGKNFPDWENKTLGEVGEFKTSSVNKKIEPGERLVKLVNYMNVYRHENINNSNSENLMTVSANKNQLEKSNLIKGDILFTPSSETPDDIGHSIVIFDDLDNVLYSYHLMRFRPAIKLDILYSHYFCNIPSVLKQITKFASGSTRFTISVGSFSSISVNIPSLEEQAKIANFLTAIDNKINLLTQQIDTAKDFKKSLLQQMFV